MGVAAHPAGEVLFLPHRNVWRGKAKQEEPARPTTGHSRPRALRQVYLAANSSRNGISPESFLRELAAPLYLRTLALTIAERFRQKLKLVKDCGHSLDHCRANDPARLGTVLRSVLARRPGHR